MLDNLLDLLRADGSIIVNKKLAKKIGLEEAAIYSELASQRNFWSMKEELKDEFGKKNEKGEWFFCTIQKLEDHTGLTRKKQDRVIDSLVNLKLIEVKLLGLPAKRHFKITNEILNVMFDNQIQFVQKGQADNPNVSNEKTKEIPRHDQLVRKGQTSKADTDKLVSPKRATINNISINNKSINKLEEEDPAHAAVISAFQENIIGSNSSVSISIRKQFKEFMNQIPVEIIMNEIEYAAANNAKTFNYLKKSLIEDISMGIDSIAKLEQKRKEHAAKNKITPIRSYSRKNAEKVPEWFEKHKMEREQGVTVENVVSPEYELKRQELLKSLGVEGY